MALKKDLIIIFSVFIFSVSTAFLVVTKATETGTNPNNTGQSSSTISSVSSSSSSLNITLPDSTKPLQNCKTVDDNLGAKSESIRNNYNKHISRYNEVYNKIKDFRDVLKSKNVSTTKLDTYITALKNNMDSFTKNYNTVVAGINENKAFTCEKSLADFQTSLDKSRQNLRVLNDSSKDILNYIKTVILPELRTLSLQANL